MSEFHRNLWAPWRMDYIRSMCDAEKEEGCFLCRYWANPSDDEKNHVIWRAGTAFVVMNRFPYTNGHLMIAHAEHCGEFDQLSDEQLLAMTRVTRECVALLRETVQAQGFNVGYNVGHCAGAGLPGHLHAHVVPRWNGDTNFMAVIGDSRVIPDSLDALYRELVKQARGMGLRP